MPPESGVPKINEDARVLSTHLKGEFLFENFGNGEVARTVHVKRQLLHGGKDRSPNSHFGLLNEGQLRVDKAREVALTSKDSQSQPPRHKRYSLKQRRGSEHSGLTRPRCI